MAKWGTRGASNPFGQGRDAQRARWGASRVNTVPTNAWETVWIDDTLPNPYLPGKLYLRKLTTDRDRIESWHLCPCGCGQKIYLMAANKHFGGAGWVVEDNPGGVDVSPSVHNTGLTCQSHYEIKQGKTVWH